MNKENYNNFSDFANLANLDIETSRKIGFDEGTRGRLIDQILFNDMMHKVNYFLDTDLRNAKILDIGCGCSYFTDFLIEYSSLNNNNLFLIDSHEMLLNLDINDDNVTKIAGKFPMSNSVLDSIIGKVDLIILNSILHHAIQENSLFNFLDSAKTFLKHFGVMYIGDIPNASKQNRQLDNYKEDTYQRHSIQGEGRLNDSIILSMISYFRGSGFNVYLMPKPRSYKFSNSRDDVLITKI